MMLRKSSGKRGYKYLTPTTASPQDAKLSKDQTKPATEDNKDPPQSDSK